MIDEGSREKDDVEGEDEMDVREAVVVADAVGVWVGDVEPGASIKDGEGSWVKPLCEGSIVLIRLKAPLPISEGEGALVVEDGELDIEIDGALDDVKAAVLNTGIAEEEADGIGVVVGRTNADVIFEVERLSPENGDALLPIIDGDAEGRREGVVLLEENGSCGDCALAIGDGILKGASCNKLR